MEHASRERILLGGAAAQQQTHDATQHHDYFSLSLHFFLVLKITPFWPFYFDGGQKSQ
jgi:hypothetical protein